MAAKKKAAKRTAARRPAAAKKVTSKAASVKPAEPKYMRIGEPWKGEGGKFMGMIRGEKGQPDYYLVLATDPRATLKGVWGPNKNITGAQSELDGMANTKAMATAGSQLAKDALAVKIDGHKDFYIPSRHEARLLHVNSPEPIGTGWHWTSTQFRDWDVSAWAQHFEDGNQDSYRKGSAFPVRLVRRVVIS